MKRALAILVVASCGTTDAPPIQSTFDAGTEGWSLQGFNTDAMDYSVSTVTGMVIWDSTDAAAQRHDLIGITDYFQAPAAFHGDLSAFATLSYKLREANADSPFDAPLVLLEGGGAFWRFDRAQTASTDWFTISLPLDGSSGWTRISGAGPFSDSLAAVTALWIRGEFSNTIEDSFLDDVTVAD